MKNNLCITFFFIFVGFILFSSCNKDNPVSATESVEEKKEKISEIGTTFLPNDILDSYLDVSDLPEDKQIEYLDTLDVAVSTFRDTLLKYYNASELEQAFNRVDQASAKLRREKGFKSEAELFNYIRLGYGKSAQLSLGGSSGFAAGIGGTLNANGGGGIEVLYDFVNMDREIYTTSFCYLGGSVGIGVEVDIKSFEVGFSGINKWILNVNTREGAGKFEGASRGASFGVSGEIQKVLGISAGISFSRTQDVLASGNFTNASVCPSGYAFDPNPSGVKEYSFETSVDVSKGLAAGLTASLEGGVLGSYRDKVDNSYTSFRREINGRRIAAFNMAKELVVHTLVSKIVSSPSAEFDLDAVVFALKYGKITYEDFESVSPSIVVAPDLINAPVTTSTHYINFSNIGSGNLEWLITTEEEWIEIGERSGFGEDKIEIKILENTTESLRSGEITINSNGGDDQTILIQQEGPGNLGSNVNITNLGTIPLALANSVITRVTFDNSIYLFGGMDGSEPYSDKIYRYDLDTNNWSDLGSVMPYGNRSHSGVVAFVNNDYMYLTPMIGPYSNNGWGEHNEIIEYDVNNNSTAFKAEFPKNMWGIQSLAVQDMIYMFGGHTGRDSKNVYKYDPVNDNLSNLGEILPDPTAHVTGILGSNELIYLFGGRAGNEYQLIIFNPITESIEYHNSDFLSFEVMGPNLLWRWENTIYLIDKNTSDVYEFNSDNITITKSNFKIFEDDTQYIPMVSQDSHTGDVYLIGGTKNGEIINSFFKIERNE